MRNMRKSRGPDPVKILYVEPAGDASKEPFVDSLTRRMAAALASSETTEECYRGFHTCVCGAISDNTNHRLPSGAVTNSLAVHYLAHHRSELSSDDLALAEAYSGKDELTPTLAQLGPLRF